MCGSFLHHNAAPLEVEGNLFKKSEITQALFAATTNLCLICSLRSPVDWKSVSNGRKEGKEGKKEEKKKEKRKEGRKEGRTEERRKEGRKEGRTQGKKEGRIT